MWTRFHARPSPHCREGDWPESHCPKPLLLGFPAVPLRPSARAALASVLSCPGCGCLVGSTGEGLRSSHPAARHAGQPRAPQRACGSGRGEAGRAPPCPAHTQPQTPTGTAGPPPWPRTSSPPRPAGRQSGCYRRPPSCCPSFPHAGPWLWGQGAPLSAGVVTPCPYPQHCRTPPALAALQDPPSPPSALQDPPPDEAATDGRVSNTGEPRR